MSSSIKLTLYTQDDCQYCNILKKKLLEWNYSYREVNVSYDLFAKDFLKNEGHRTVPQLYWNNLHLNKMPTLELQKRDIEAEINYEDYIGGVENWQIQKTA
jgi:glutaredoxin